MEMRRVGMEGVGLGVVRGWRGGKRVKEASNGCRTLRETETPGAFTDRVSAIPAPAVSAVPVPS